MSENDPVSDAEPEYEVEFISRAKVERKGRGKQWLYHVKWKNYGVEDNTWEPFASFKGSEHFVDTFWEKVHDKRDWKDMSQFQDQEEILPIGPPPRRKKMKTNGNAQSVSASVPVKSAEVISSKPRSSRGKPESSKSTGRAQPKPPSSSAARGTHKRKFTELANGDEDDEVLNASANGSSESEVKSIIATPVPVSRGRPKRRINTTDEVEEVEPEEQRTSSRSRRAAASASVSRKATASTGRPRGRPRKVPASASAISKDENKTPRKRGRPRKNAKEHQKKTASPELVLSDTDAPGEIVNDEDDDEDEMQVDTGVEADVEDEAPMEVTEDTVEVQVTEVQNGEQFGDAEEVPSSDVMEQEQVALEVEVQMETHLQSEDLEEPAEPEAAPVTPPPMSPKIPAHRARAANPRVKVLDDVGTGPVDGGPSGITTKARIARQLTHHDTPDSPVASHTNGSPSTSAPKARRKSKVKPGPGRSSSGFQLGSTSLLTVVKKGTIDTLRRAFTSSSKPLGEIVSESEHEAEILEPPEVPTGEQLLHMAGLDARAADELPDFEEADHGEAASSAAPVQELAITQEVDNAVNGDTAHETDKVVTSEPEAIQAEMVAAEAEAQPIVVSASGNMINRPTETIGRSNSGSGDMAAWRQTTIFGPLGVGRDAPITSPVEQPESPTTGPHVVSLVLTSSLHLPIVLKDIQPSLSPDMKPLNEIAVNLNTDAPGQFYATESADVLVTALRTGGSCGRVMQDPAADERQQHDFERFSARLKEGELYLATINAHTLAFCSSENVSISAKMGFSPNLVGLGNSVLVSEVEIRDTNVYANLVVDGKGSGW